MASIGSDLTAFSNALKNSAIICTSDGYWVEISENLQKSHALIGKDHHRLNKIAEVFTDCLDKLEKSQVSSAMSNEKVAEYLDTAGAVLEVLDSQGLKSKKFYEGLKSRVASLKSRQEFHLEERADSETVRKVHELASEWKLASHIRGHEDLDVSDLNRLRKIERYSAFSEQLVSDEELRSRFFDWTLRDRVDPEAFILFPATCERLTQARLSHRIGYYGGEHLKVKRIQGGEGRQSLDLTLPMGGKEVSILDDRLIVQLEEGYTQSVGQIIETFINRQWEIGNVEYFRDGVHNWNPKRLGPYNPETGEYRQVDLEKERWWEEMPVVEELSVEQAKQRYDLDLDGSQWVMAVRASREQENDTPINIHGWMQVAIPINGRYRLFDFGKYTEDFPQAWYEFVDITVNSVPAVITYPDEAAFALDRQHTWHAVATTPAEGEALLKSVSNDMELVNEENIAFQFISDNCIKWAWSKVNEVVGDEKMPAEVVQMDFNDLKPGGVMGVFFTVLRCLPFEIRWLVLTLIVTLFGAWKGMRIHHLDGTSERVSLLTQLPWSRGGKFYSPGQVFRYQTKE